MSNDRDRIADALRKTPGAEPPVDLASKIKGEIPQVIGSSGDGGRRQQYWLLAATLLLLVAGGWFAAQLLRTQESVPAVQIAEQAAPVFEGKEDAPSSPAVARDAAVDSDDGTTRPVAKNEALLAPAEPQSSEEQVGDAGRTKVPEPLQSVAEVLPETESTFEEKRSRVAEAAAPSDLMRAPAAPKPAVPAQTNASPPPSTSRSGERERSERDSATRPTEEAPKLGALEKASASTLADRRLDAVEPPAASLDWDELSAMILEGSLPPPEAVDTHGLISHFDYGDRPPWRRGRVSIFVEGGAAPLSPGRWRTVRIGIRSRESSVPVATDAELEVRFDPDTVSLYREVGTSSTIRTERDPAMIEELGSIPGSFATSRLFEVKLLPDVDLDQIVASAMLRYETDRGSEQIDRIIRVGHVSPTWRSTSSSLQVATLVGGLAEYLRGQLVPRTGVDLVYLADNLAAAKDGDENAAELAVVVSRAAELRMRR